MWSPRDDRQGRPRRRGLETLAPAASRGFTAVELLVACLIGALALAAAWSWLFTTVAAGGREEHRLEVETSLAFVTRLTAAELRRASLFLAAPAPGCSAHSVRFVVTDSDGSTETVAYVWNPATGVLWRKSAASHLADDVTAFSVDYFDATGAALVPAASSLSANELSQVRRLRLSAVVSWGTGEARASWDVTPRARR